MHISIGDLGDGDRAVPLYTLFRDVPFAYGCKSLLCHNAYGQPHIARRCTIRKNIPLIGNEWLAGAPFVSAYHWLTMRMS
eukprot:3518339-Karenia_brevis.AAC.1